MKVQSFARSYLACWAVAAAAVTPFSPGCVSEPAEPLAESIASVPLPNSEAGRLVAEYLAAFNCGEEEAMKEYMHRTATATGPGGNSVEQRIASQRHFYNASRGLDVYSATQPDDNEIGLVTRMRLTDHWRRMNFFFEGQPKKLSGIRIVPIDPPAEAAAAKGDLQSSLNDYIKRQTAADQFSGVVLIRRGGETLFEHAGGIADRDTGRLIKQDTTFSCASVGKMFTATAIAKLVETGQISFDSVLADILPEFADSPHGKVRLHHLLTHQSGIPDYFENIALFEQANQQERRLTAYLPIFASMKGHFAAGERFEYSNSNYFILGSVIEKITGQAYANYVQSAVFEPAGMQDTSMRTGDRKAVNYTELTLEGKMTPGQRRDNRFSGEIGGPAGGAVTTAADLAKFFDALASHQLLKHETLEKMWSEHTAGQRPGESYGYGFILRRSPLGRVVGHSGGYPGVDAQVNFWPDNGTSVIVLCNYEAVGEPVAQYAERLLQMAK